MNKICILLLMMSIFTTSVYAQKGRAVSQTSTTQSIVSPDDMIMLTSSTLQTAKSYLEKKGYKSGSFSNGLYFYKNTQVKLTKNNRTTTPTMVNPTPNASLIMVCNYEDAPYQDYVFYVLNTCKSKKIVDKWVAELRKMGYKSKPAESSSSQTRWSYYHPGDNNNTFDLIYFKASGEYLLTRIR